MKNAVLLLDGDVVEDDRVEDLGAVADGAVLPNDALLHAHANPNLRVVSHNAASGHLRLLRDVCRRADEAFLLALPERLQGHVTRLPRSNLSKLIIIARNRRVEDERTARLSSRYDDRSSTRPQKALLSSTHAKHLSVSLGASYVEDISLTSGENAEGTTKPEGKSGG